MGVKMRQKRQNYMPLCGVKGRIDMKIQINDMQVHSHQTQMKFDSRDFLKTPLFLIIHPFIRH